MNNIPQNPSTLTRILLGIILMLLSGLTIMWLWGWYIVPLGLPAISFVHALGLDLFISFVVTTQVNTQENQFWTHFIFGVTFAVMTAFLGWVFHFAM